MNVVPFESRARCSDHQGWCQETQEYFISPYASPWLPTGSQAVEALLCRICHFAASLTMSEITRGVWACDNAEPGKEGAASQLRFKCCSGWSATANPAVHHRTSLIFIFFFLFCATGKATSRICTGDGRATCFTGK